MRSFVTCARLAELPWGLPASGRLPMNAAGRVFSCGVAGKGGGEGGASIRVKLHSTIFLLRRCACRLIDNADGYNNKTTIDNGYNNETTTTTTAVDQELVSYHGGSALRTTLELSNFL